MLKRTNKSLVFAAGAVVFVTLAMNAFAVLPPKYLSVKNFQQCLGTKNMGTWTAWCLPNTKPEACPNESWQQLNGLTEKDRMPSC